MQWSQIKKRVEAFLVPELRGRVQFYITTYRREDDSLLSPAPGRGWITVDGEEVASFSSNGSGTEASPSRQEFYEALVGYPTIAIDAALHSDNVVVRALAMIDRRLGKRRIAALDPEQQPELVGRMLILRKELKESR